MNATQYRLLTAEDGKTIPGDEFYSISARGWMKAAVDACIGGSEPVRRPFRPPQWLSVKDSVRPEVGRAVPVLFRWRGRLWFSVEVVSSGHAFSPSVEYWLDAPPFPEEKSEAEEAWEECPLSTSKNGKELFIAGFNAARRAKP